MFYAQVVTTNGSAFNHDKSLQIYFLCTERQAKKDFLKDIENIVDDFECAHANSERYGETAPPRSLAKAFRDRSLTYSIELVKANLDQDFDI